MLPDSIDIPQRTEKRMFLDDIWKEVDSFGTEIFSFADSLVTGVKNDISNVFQTLQTISAVGHVQAEFALHHQEGTTIESISQDFETVATSILGILQ